jgi:hypothetical protein
MSHTAEYSFTWSALYVAGSSHGRDHFVGTHHLVVFVLEVMAVPDVATGIAHERNDDPRYGQAVDPNRIFPTPLFRVGGRGRTRVVQYARCRVVEGIERSTIENLKPDHMQMNRMHILGHVSEFP